MSRTSLLGLVGAALLIIASATGPALAIRHGCTNPPDIKTVKIDVIVDGRTSTVAGSYCEAIEEAKAIIDGSRASRSEKRRTSQALGELSADPGGSSTAAKGNVNANLTCDTNGNCTGSITVGVSF